MAIKKTIAIVGATEKTGTALLNQFVQTDYRLLLVSKDIDKLNQLAQNIRAKNSKAEIDSVECVKDGCWEADIIILAVVPQQEREVAEIMKEVATQKIVVSISDERNANKDLQKILPYSKLVSVGNILQSKEIFISGIDHAVNEEISTIFNHAGYHSTITRSLNHPITDH